MPRPSRALKRARSTRPSSAQSSKLARQAQRRLTFESLEVRRVMAFTPGDVFAGAGSSPYAFVDVTEGGDLSSSPPHALLPGATTGQIAWSANRETAYVTQYDSGTVVAVNSAGEVNTFASGLGGPTGLIRTTDGRLLVSASYFGAVYDITAGGDFTNAEPWAQGLSGLRNLVQLSNGHILAAEWGTREVTDITGGGAFWGATPHAWNLPEAVIDLAQSPAGNIYLSTAGPVLDITAGGDYAGATPFASGKDFVGITFDGSGRFLATTYAGSEIFDISAGGDLSNATPFASGLPTGFGESALDTVPSDPPAPVFTPGQVLAASGNTPYTLVDVSAGGNLSSVSPLANLPSNSYGQIAWSEDRSTAYVSQYGIGEVVAVSASGVVTTFATGLSGPMGLLRTNTGRLLVSTWNNGMVFDITAGGHFAGATPFASGLSGPRNLLQLSDGKILIAELGSNEVTEITAGGDFGSAQALVANLPGGATDLVQSESGKVYVSAGGEVVELTGGATSPGYSFYATGQTFFGLTIDGSGKLLATTYGGSEIYDITTGGNYASAAPFAYGLPGGFGEAALDTVPGDAPEVPKFEVGDVFAAAGNNPYVFVDVTAGGDLTFASPLATLPANSLGQIAWSPNRTTAYVTLFHTGEVVAISATGTVNTFATGLNGPKGLILTRDGRLLVSSFNSGTIIDITNGGNFSSATPFASGLSNPHNLLQLSDGRIYVAEGSSGEVTEITAGGDRWGAAAFAHGLPWGPADLVQSSSGQIYVTAGDAVFNITAGGYFGSAPAFAFGQNFAGLTFDGAGKLLATTYNGSDIYDITAGGNFSGATPFAFGLPGGFGHTALDTITNIVVEPPTFTPGDVFAVSADYPYVFMNVTAGGYFGSRPPFANLPAPSFGQIAWSQDRTKAYVALADGTVAAVSAVGSVTTFATGINFATGLIRTSDGRLLVSSVNSGNVYDITSGGDFSSAAPFATGLSGPRNLLQLPNGKILVTEYGSNEVTDITSGGNFSGAPAYASNLPNGVADLVYSPRGEIFVTAGETIYEITAGGDYGGLPAHAFGQNFAGLTFDKAGRLLATTQYGTRIYDVTQGGSFSSATPFAFGLPGGFGSSGLDTVPFEPVAQATFERGDVFAAAANSPFGFMNVSSGGNLNGLAPLANLPSNTYGQVAWSHDLTTAYVTQFFSGEVLEVSATGAVRTFARYIDGPKGLLRTSDGRLLVTSSDRGIVYDITDGTTSIFASGLTNPGNLLQLANGKVYVAESSGEITEITAGGDVSGASPFASGLPGGAADLVQSSSGQILASAAGGVFNVTSGGYFGNAAPFAFGQGFAGLAYDESGRLLATTFNGSDIYDISSGGDLSGATPFAYGLPGGFGGTALDSIPMDPPSPPVFTAGDLFGAAGYYPYFFMNLTGGGDLSGRSPFATLPNQTFGQIAWSQDLTTAYVSQFTTGNVLSIAALGKVKVFASGFDGPMGLVSTSDGRLLVSAYYSGNVYDITSGGNFATATPFATGLSNPRNLLQLSNGKILVAETGSGEVTDITAGGESVTAPVFASSLSAVTDLVQTSNGAVFASAGSSVYEITVGGSYSSAQPYATGQDFAGLAIDPTGRLLATARGRGQIYDITRGGYFGSATPYATGLISGFGEAAFDTVPFDPQPTGTFEPGDVLAAAMNSPFNLMNVTGGGYMYDQLPISTLPGGSFGQITWSEDLTTAYITQVQLGKVLAINALGMVTTFATGIQSPTGLIMTSNGRLLVSSLYDGKVLDISAGGDFSQATPFAYGLTYPRNFVELTNGRVYVAESASGEVTDITAGGDFTSAAPFAIGVYGASDLVQAPSGQIFVSAENAVFNITAGGNFSNAVPFASGQNFAGLTFDVTGRLLATTYYGTRIYEITRGGDYSNATPFAWELPYGFGNSALDTVPFEAADIPVFTTGDVFGATAGFNQPYSFMDVTNGGNFGGKPPLAKLWERSIGQIAWSADLKTAYVTQFDSGMVLAISRSGAITAFATGISSPVGLIRTSSGQLLVSSYNNGAIYDITKGGSFAGATPFANGLHGPRNLLQLGDGRIYVAESGSREVTDITNGGYFVGRAPFAYNLPETIDLVQSSTGTIYVTAGNAVFNITSGGDFGGASPFAYGRQFVGLAINAQGKLLATTYPGEIFDISAGGSFSSATPFAAGLPSEFGQAAFDTVPAALTLSPGLISNGDFEAGSTSWNVTTEGSGPGFSLDAPGTTTPTLQRPTAGNPAGGGWYRVSDQTGVIRSALMQEFTVPADARQVQLAFQMFVNSWNSDTIVNNAGLSINAGPNQHARVDIVRVGAEALSTTPGDVLKNLYLGTDAEHFGVNPYRSYKFDISDYVVAGGTYQIRFAYAATNGPLNVGVDNVEITTSSVAAPKFAAGDVFSASPNTAAFVNVTAGGDLSSAPVFAMLQRSVGQISWSTKRSTAYVTQPDNDSILAISPTGVVSTFATGIPSPVGLLRTSDGRLQVSSYQSGGVYDITAGGNFANASPFAYGLIGPRNLLQLSDGRIYVAEANTWEVTDITTGGNFAGAMPVAYGLPGQPLDLVQAPDGRVLVSAGGQVLDISGHGNFSSAPIFANGQNFAGLAVDGDGRVLATTLNGYEIYDITAGGYFWNATPFATNLPGGGGPALDSVPREDFQPPVLSLDFGDAPLASDSGFVSNYPTLLADNGARHVAIGPTLGGYVDVEADGLPTANAHQLIFNGPVSGDGQDETGVTFLGPLVKSGQPTTGNVIVNLQNAATSKLDAWIDFNRDGDWDDAGEQVFSSQSLIAGNNRLSFAVPAEASTGVSFARFRVSTVGGVGTTGLAADGEVEDYSVNIISSPTFDSTFDADGVVVTSVEPTRSDAARGVALQADGKIVVVGEVYDGSSVKFLVLRYNTDGTLDNTFDGDGKVTTSFGSGSQYAQDLVIQADGKIVVVGQANGFAVARYNPNGSLDTSFDADGKRVIAIGSSSAAADVALDSAGRIVIVGTAHNGSNNDMAAVRLNSDGSLDESFDADGIAQIPFGSGNDAAQAVAIQPAGGIVLVGESANGSSTRFAVARLAENGSLDPLFDGDGKAIIDFGSSYEVARDVAIDDSGRIIVVGTAGGFKFGVARLTESGELDASFHDDGKVVVNFTSAAAHGVALQQNGKIVVVGSADFSTSDTAIVRLLQNGPLDASFDGDGRATWDLAPFSSDVANGVAVQSDGRLVLAGTIASGNSNLDVSVVRLLGDNVPPKLILNTGATIEEGGSRTITSSELLATDGNQSPDQLLYSVLSGPAYGHLELSNNPGTPLTTFTQEDISAGRLRYVHHGGEETLDQFSFAISDGQGSSIEATFEIAISASNDSPTISSQPSLNIDEDAVYVYEFTAVDVDPDASLTITATTLPSWLTLVDHGDGTATLSGTPTNDDLGDHPVLLEVTDGIASAVQQSFTITVANTNDGPTALELSAISIAENAAAGTVVGSFTTADADVGDAFTYLLVDEDGSTDNAAFTIEGNQLHLVEPLDYEAQSSYLVRVLTRDAAGAEFVQEFTIEVVNVNEAGQLAVAGIARQGEVLSAVLDDLDGISGGGAIWLWERSADGNGWTTIVGANEQTYQLTQADVNQLLRASATYTDAGGFSENVVSSATGAVENINDAPSGTTRTLTMNEDATQTLLGSAFGFKDLLDSPANILAGVKITTLPGAGTLTLRGVAVAAGETISAADLAAGQLRYKPAANANGTSYASFTFQVQDDGGVAHGGSDLDPTPNSFTFNVTAVNDTPQITGFTGDVTYVENAASPVVVASSAIVRDVDLEELTNGTLTLKYTSGGSADDRLWIRNTAMLMIDGSGTVFYDGTVVGSVAGGEGTTPLVVTFNENMTAAIATSLLRNVVYSNVSDAPRATRLLWAQITDGNAINGISAAVTKTINVTAVKDKPVVLGFGDPITYTEGDPNLPVAPSTVSVVEPDQENLGGGSLTVKISNGVRPEDILGIRSGGAITTNAANEVLYNNLPIGTYSGGAGGPLVITFNANATAFRASLLLQRIYYRNSSQKPLEHDRTLWVQVNDGQGLVSNPVTKTLSVVAVNDPPTLTGFSTSPVGYVRNAGGAVAPAPGALVKDVDNANFNTGSLTVEVILGVDAGNVLSIAGPHFKVDAEGNLWKGSARMGKVEQHTANKLEISFNDQALLVRVQDLIRAIRFKTSGSLLEDDRTIAFTIRDSAGGEPVTQNATIDVM